MTKALPAEVVQKNRGLLNLLLGGAAAQATAAKEEEEEEEEEEEMRSRPSVGQPKFFLNGKN